MLYKNLGLSFYYCAADPNKEIFVIEMEAPARASTNKGILLGLSTIDDVLRVYGEPEGGPGLEYEGIYFYADEDTDGDDGDDARIAPPPSETKEVQASAHPEGSETVHSNVSVQRVNSLQYFDPIDKDSDVEITNRDSDEDDVEAAKTTASDRAKIVRRIELIEKSGLRQCDSKFGKFSK
jgi:hypothetical protein